MKVFSCSSAAFSLTEMRSGRFIPQIGLGVYQSSPGAETYDAVLSALRIGYRHIDTAQFYANEADVGRAIKDSGIPREEVFVTSKLFPPNFGYDKAIKAMQDSLDKLQIGYIDLFLLHAPGDPSVRDETWKALEKFQADGLLRDIGVSNFGIPHLEKLALKATELPAVNQIEIHPWLQRSELVKYCHDHGIVVEAYSPLAKAQALSDPVLLNVASRNGATPAQILVAYSLAKGLVTLPKSVNPERQQSNLDAATAVKLTEADIAELDTLEAYMTTGWDPVRTAPV